MLPHSLLLYALSTAIVADDTASAPSVPVIASPPQQQSIPVSQFQHFLFKQYVDSLSPHNTLELNGGAYGYHHSDSYDELNPFVPGKASVSRAETPTAAAQSTQFVPFQTGVPSNPLLDALLFRGQPMASISEPMVGLVAMPEAQPAQTVYERVSGAAPELIFPAYMAGNVPQASFMELNQPAGTPQFYFGPSNGHQIIGAAEQYMKAGQHGDMVGNGLDDFVHWPLNNDAVMTARASGFNDEEEDANKVQEMTEPLDIVIVDSVREKSTKHSDIEKIMTGMDDSENVPMGDGKGSKGRRIKRLSQLLARLL